MLRILCLCSVFLFTGCAVSEEAIKNKELYCSDIYKGIRAVGRVATEVTTGVSVPDVCDTIDEIVEEENEEGESTDSALGKSSIQYQRSYKNSFLS